MTSTADFACVVDLLLGENRPHVCRRRGEVLERNPPTAPIYKLTAGDLEESAVA